MTAGIDTTMILRFWAGTKSISLTYSLNQITAIFALTDANDEKGQTSYSTAATDCSFKYNKAIIQKEQNCILINRIKCYCV